MAAKGVIGGLWSQSRRYYHVEAQRVIHLDRETLRPLYFYNLASA